MPPLLQLQKLLSRDVLGDDGNLESTDLVADIAIQADGTAVAGGIAGMIGGAAGLAIPHAQTQGSSGAWYQLIAPCVCYMTFFPIIEDDNDRFGRPLAGKGRVSDYPGYLICQNVNFPITNILATEYRMIKEEMESGFFYE